MRRCSKCNYCTDDVIRCCPFCGSNMISDNPAYNNFNNNNNNSFIKQEKVFPILMFIMSLICLVFSFVVILNNASFFIGLVAFVASFFLLFGKKYKKIPLISCMIISLIGMTLTYNYQKQISDKLDDVKKDLNNMSGTNTKDLMGKSVNITIGKFKMNKTSIGILDSELEVVVQNITSDTASFSIAIEALDANGNRIDIDYIYALDLAPNQSATYKAFTYLSSDKYDAMKTARFNINSISMIKK